MHILVDLRKVSNRPSGIGIYTYEFVKAIAQMNEGIIFTGVTDVIKSSEIKELKELGVSLLSYEKEVNKNIEVIKYNKFIKCTINEVKPNIFWQPNNISPIKIKNPYGKVMTTIHDIFPITAKDNYSFLYRKYFARCLKKTIKSSDALIFVSQFTKDEVFRNYSYAKKKEYLISYNIASIDIDSDKNLKNDDGNYFLFVGNVERRKGIDILIEAFNIYRRNGGTKKLYIAGGMRDSAIEDMIKGANSVHNAIECKGYVSSKEKEKLMRSCSAFVFPSRAEGFGIPPLEAISYDKNCILSDIAVFKEVFLDSVNYFELDQNLHKAAENLKEQLFEFQNIEDKKLILERYSMENLGKKFAQFVSKLI